MGLFTKKQVEDFNAVIEGAYHGEWNTLNYKVTQIDISENTAVLNDGSYRFRLYGKTGNFENMQEVRETGDLEADINNLTFHEGVTLPHHGGIPNILERPRAICMQDGRVYVDEKMIKKPEYLQALPYIIKTAGEIFNSDEVSDLYKKVIS